MQQIGDPGRGQARVEREDRGTGAVQRRRQRVKEAASPGGGREQESMQGTSSHQRKVNGQKLWRNGRVRRDRVAAGVTGGRDQVAGLLDGMRAFAIPMRTRFRGITVREGALIEGPAGWGEFSPFAEYGPRECARWLACALEAATAGWPAPVRDRVPVNVTVPAVGPARAHALVTASGCRTAKVKVAERGQSLADDVARVEAVRDALGSGGAIRVDANGA